MSRNKTLSRLMPDASLPRNSFDRGFSIKYNFSAGMLLPTFVQYCVGGSKVKINMKEFIRSASVNTSAMTSVRFFTDFYYVPLRLLFSQFGQFKTKTNDLHSSLYGSVSTNLPRISKETLQTLWSVGSDPTDQPYDICGFPMEPGIHRLMELFGYGSNSSRFADVGSIVPWAACAYQKVYFDHYRNYAYEANDPSAYNMDKYYNSPQISDADAFKMLTLRYCNYRKDFFGNIYPSLNYLKSGVGSQYTWSVPDSVVKGSTLFGNQLVNVSNIQNSAALSQNAYQTGESTYQTGFDLQSLRAAFALDKLVRASAYAPQHVKDQYQARFGFKPKGYSMDESYRLGSYKCDIVFGEVTSVSDSYNSQTEEGSTLGQIGGKGVGGSDFGQVISHQCADDCIIIGISYAMPRISYDALMVDRFAQKFVATDYFQPEFMNMGLQPVYFKDISSTILNATNNIIVGYVPRYSEYKINVDKNFGLFRQSNPLGIFTMHGRSHYSIGSGGLSAAFFKCNPADMNDIFAEDYTGEQLTDQFFGMLEFAFACVAPMSIHGVPSL